MYPSSNHLLKHAHKEDHIADRDNCRSTSEAIKGHDQETIHAYYHNQFGMDGHNAMWGDMVPCGAVSDASTHKKINYERLLQEGFNLSSPTLITVKRKPEKIDVSGSGRKDKHSKVSTARGPRDRRVRLSPRTAIQFYDVQDRLGYDRPSKAIDWLIKEAKTAIDALQEQPLSISSNHFSTANHGNPNGNSQQMIHKQDDLNDENHVSTFSFFLDGTVSPVPYTELQAFPDQELNPVRNSSKVPEAEDATLHPSYRQGILSALTTTNLQILETNWEVARLQKTLTWNCVTGARGERVAADYSSSANSPPLHYLPNLGNNEAFPQSVNLHSSIINYSPLGINFPGFSFSNELSNVTAQKDGETEKYILNNTSSATPFLNY